MKHLRAYIPYGLLFFFLLIGGFLRFTYIDWGKPFFFHPDENNITNAILQLTLTQWNPHFFAYGGLPIYSTFILSLITNFKNVSFASVAYTLRNISAAFSFLLIPSLFYIGSTIWNKSVGLIAAGLACFSIGFIQFAHFGTFEMWFTFCELWFFYVCFLTWRQTTLTYAVLCGVLGGLFFSIKVSSIVFLPIPIVIFLLQKKVPLQKKLSMILTYSVFVSLIYFATNPFLFLDTNSFIHALSYESSVAVGTYAVFYTQSFLNTIPIIYQLRYVLPFLLNPLVFAFFLFTLPPFLFFVVKEKKIADILLSIFFFIAFFSQAVLFVKWTRYMVPTLPFIYLFIARILDRLQKKVRVVFTIFLLTISCLVSFAFLNLVYSRDTRIAAEIFAITHMNSQQSAIVEPYDLGALAFNNAFSKTQIINIYQLEENPIIQNQLQSSLKTMQVFISPSQRLIHTRLTNDIVFPKGNTFYKNLLDGTNGFHIIYQTSCSWWCQIIYLGNPLLGSVEETATVFDHPFVTIFQKS